MMNKHVEGLREALKMWQERDCAPVEVRAGRAVKLSLFGLFTAKEISQITGVSKNTVEQRVKAEVNRRNERSDPMFKTNFTVRDFLDIRMSVFNPRDLDALFLLAEEYHEDGHLPVMRGRLVRALVADGNSVYTISELTGIHLDELREVLYGDPDDPSVV